MVQVTKKPRLIHRSRIDIIASILHAADDGARRTHIMYRCNLSFRQLQTYLDFLVERKLIKRSKAEESQNTSGKYQTTAKGKAFIEAYKNIHALLSPSALES